MKILAFDTAMNACSVCVYDTKAGDVVSKIAPMLRGHAECLLPMLQDILKEAATEFSDIGLIAVTKGPGAFTGMRIGLATAKAFSLSLDVPSVGICTFEAVLRTFFAKNLEMKGHRGGYAVILETKRDDFYVRLFEAGGVPEADGFFCAQEELMSISDIRERVLIGDGIKRFITAADGMQNFKNLFQIDFPMPEEIAYLAERMYTDAGLYGCGVSPVYLRSADVSQPKRPIRYIKNIL